MRCPYHGATSRAVKVSLDRVQRAGVRSEAAVLRILARPVKAPGIAKINERTLRSVSLRADGFIDKLIVNATGEDVKAGAWSAGGRLPDATARVHHSTRWCGVVVADCGTAAANGDAAVN